MAVLLVVLYHSGVPFLSGGYVGVDVFFVISGYLITSHLWSEVSRTNRLDFAAFYARRARRILPAALVVIVGTLAFGVLFMPPLQVPLLFKDAIASALYVPNIKFALDDTNYLAETAPSPFQHYWSLGIEEQFYLIWPLVLVAVAGWCGRGSLRWAIRLAATLTALSLVACVWLTPRSEVWAFFFPATRVWEFGFGALLAFFAAQPLRTVSKRVGSFVGLTGLLAIGIAALYFDSKTQFPGFASLLPVVGTTLVILSGNIAPVNRAAQILSVRPMQFVGKISYSLYLVHWPLLVIPQAAIGLSHPLPVWATLLISAVGIPLSWLLYRYIESPARTAKFLTAAAPSRTLLATAFVTVLLVVGSQAGRAIAANQQLSTDLTARSYEMQKFPVGQASVPGNLNPALWQVADDLPETYRNACHLSLTASDPAECIVGSNLSAPLVALFGDSHAAQWYPALAGIAEEGLIRLETHTKSGCQSIVVPAVGQCENWRQQVIDRLSNSDHDLIIIANYDNGDIYSGDVFRSGLAELADLLGDDAPLVRIADTPRPRWTPAICLSANIDTAHNCDLDRDVALDFSGATEEIATIPVIDFTDYFCRDDSCPVIIDNLLVYRDDSHITAAFASALSPLFRSVIAERTMVTSVR